MIPGGLVVVVDPCVVIAFGKIFGDAFRGIAGFVGEPQQIALAVVEGQACIATQARQAQLDVAL